MTENDQLPLLPIKIIRRGGQLKIDYGGYELILKPLEGYTQTYSGLIFDKFMVATTTKLLERHVNEQKSKENAKHNLEKLGLPATDAMAENVMAQISEPIKEEMKKRGMK